MSFLNIFRKKNKMPVEVITTKEEYYEELSKEREEEFKSTRFEFVTVFMNMIQGNRHLHKEEYLKTLVGKLGRENLDFNNSRSFDLNCTGYYDIQWCNTIEQTRKRLRFWSGRFRIPRNYRLDRTGKTEH